MADNKKTEAHATAQETPAPKTDRVTVVNAKGVEANPLRKDLDKWKAKGWKVKGAA